MFKIFNCGGKMEDTFVVIKPNGEIWDFHNGHSYYTKHKIIGAYHAKIKHLLIDFRN